MPVLRLHPAVFAGILVLAASSDWALVSPEHPELPPICAKSQATCEAARDAIRRGVLGWEPVYNACRPHPGCFSAESETIRR
jgi:hypothetical protein